MSEHEHSFVFKGTYYTLSAGPRPGSGAYDRYLVDVFYCSGCLHEETLNKRGFGNSYEPTGGVFPR